MEKYGGPEPPLSEENRNTNLPHYPTQNSTGDTGNKVTQCGHYSAMYGFLSVGPTRSRIVRSGNFRLKRD